MKHFCGNNQEANRHGIDSIISERALREIYLKGYEMAVKNGGDSVMTTYGLVNGIHTSSSYDLNTTILRDDWGFKIYFTKGTFTNNGINSVSVCFLIVSAEMLHCACYSCSL